MKTSIKHITLGLFAAFLLLFTSCKKDLPIIDLLLDQSEVELYTKQEAKIKIISGNGTYQVNSSEDSIGTAKIVGQTIIITGISKGSATINITDEAGKTSSVSIKVKSTTLDEDTPHFRWEEIILLEQANSWGITSMANAVALSNLNERRQIILSWKGGYENGKKTEAKLRIIAIDKDPKEYELSDLMLQLTSNNRYNFTFKTEDNNGQLVFSK